MLTIDGIIFSLQRSGGISIYFNEIIKRMIRDNYSCRLILYPNNNDMLTQSLHKFMEEGKSAFPISIERYLPCRVNNIDVFHSTYYRLPKNKKKSKIVTTVHDFTYERYMAGFRKTLHHWQKRQSVLASDLVICISESTKRDLLKYIPEVEEDKVKVIYNGVSSDFYYNPELNKNNSGNNVVFVGARNGYKNFSSVVDAVKILDDINLIIVGGGGLTNDEVYILDSAIKGRYTHLGYVCNEELNKIYNNAVCLLYPSLYEGFGIPVIEAMKAGCPVIATNASSIPEVAGDAAILLDTPNGDNIADAISYIMKSSCEDEYRKRGILRSKLFSWENTYQELRSCYELLGA